MPVFKHRDRLTIFAEILKTTSESKRGSTKRDIVKNVNLSYAQANKFLSLLLTERLLCLSMETRYKPTEKGLRLMNSLKSLNLGMQS